MKYIYSRDYTITYSYVDRTGRLGILEFLNINQDMITSFCGYIGSDNPTIKAKNNAAWLYTRIKVKVNELPFWNTKTKAVAFVTSKSPIRMTVETNLFNENDELLVVARTEMCVIDLELRKIRKIDSVEFPSDLEVMDSNFEEGFSKMNDEFTSQDLIYSQKVFASDTDFTHHTNNVRYVKFIMNTFEESFYDEKKVKGFEIQYAKETRANDSLDVLRKETSDTEYSFLIKTGDEAAVKAKLWY